MSATTSTEPTEINNPTETKVIKIYGKQSVLPIPIRFVRALGWERYQELFMIMNNNKDGTIELMDVKTFAKTKLADGMKINKTTLTGSNNIKGFFNHRIMLHHALFPNNTHVSLKLQDSKIIIKKYDEG